MQKRMKRMLMLFLKLKAKMTLNFSDRDGKLFLIILKNTQIIYKKETHIESLFTMYYRLLMKCLHHDPSNPYGRMLVLVHRFSHTYVHQNSHVVPVLNWQEVFLSDMYQSNLRLRIMQA